MVNASSLPFLRPAFIAPQRRRFGPAAWLWVLLLLVLSAAGPALAANIEVSLDRNPVAQNESFTLIFAADGNPDGDPDFSPLEEDFEIVGQNHSSQFSLNNGHASHRIEWRLSVMAKRTGTLDIPAVAFGSDHSKPFAVTILPARSSGSRAKEGEDILLEVEAEPKNPYVQAQTIYTLRVLSHVAIGEARVAPPEAGDALVEKLDGEHKALTSRNGVQYRMSEVRYAVFPQKSGPLRIEPVRLEVQIPARGHFPFGQFFGQPGQARRMQSEAIELDVRPIPAEFTGKHWLPAENVSLEDSWAAQPPKIGAGEPITRTLTLKAEGATVGVMPELNAALPASADFKQYPDQPALREEKRSDGVLSLRQEKTALIASQPGTYTMPAVEIPWWNTRTGRMELARLPERTLTVTPSAEARPAEPAPPPPETATAPSSPAPAPAVPAAPRPAAGAPAADVWFWLALLFGLGWIGTGMAWWLGRRPKAETPAPNRAAAPLPHRQLAEAVEQACQANDAAAAKRALAAWAAARWPGKGLAELERQGGAGLNREIGQLDRALYAPGGTDWQGERLRQCFRDFVATAEKQTAAAPELEPLYKLQSGG